MSDNLALPSGVTLRPETDTDKAAVDALIAAAFGPSRHKRSVRHLRQSTPVASLCFVIEQQDKLIGSIRYWPVLVAGRAQLLLGPLAVHPDHKGQGLGKKLVAHSLEQAVQHEYDFILISGEPDYYPRFGFEAADTKAFMWPGFIEAERFQIKWLKEERRASYQTDGAAILPIL